MKRQKNTFSKVIALLLCGTMMLGLLPMLTLTATSAGMPDTGWYASNPEASSFIISTADELAGLAQLSSTNTFQGKTITLTSDIDLSVYGKGYNSGRGWNPIGKYKGTFDGGGHTITGLYINDTTTRDLTGLFGCVEGGTVKGVGIENAVIRGRMNGSNGGIVGNAIDQSRISYCYFIGDITISGDIPSSNKAIGGIAGAASNGTIIEHCYSFGAISANGSRSGGIAGILTDGTWSEFVGATSIVRNCYSTMTIVEGSSSGYGGITGEMDGSTRVENCAAFNPYITGEYNSSIGRVTGHQYTYWGTPVRVNNIAFSGMLLRGATVVSSSLTSADGQDITAASIASNNGMFGNRFTVANGWTVAPGRLPGFGTTYEIPAPLRTDAPRVTSVSVSPSTATVLKGETRQFTATVTGENNPLETVIWEIVEWYGKSSGTTISSTGLLTVAKDETLATLTVRASSTTDLSKYGTAKVSNPTTVTNVSISPPSPIVRQGATQQFTAAATGTNSPAQTVTWSVSGRNSTNTTISSAGVLTVASNETASSLTVRATSTVTTSVSGTTTVTLPTVTSISVTPSNPIVQQGATKQFTAEVNGTNNPAQTVTWSVSGNKNSSTKISSAGVLTIGDNESATTLTVKATSTINTSQSGTTTVTLPTVTAVTVSSSKTEVFKGATQQINVVVTGINNPTQSVTWSISNAWVEGTKISEDGILTIAKGEYSTGITVKATSTIDTTKFGEIVIVPKNPPTVSSVHVTPYIIDVQKGTTQAFTPDVIGMWDPPQTVTWKVIGNTSSGTKISVDGVLTVALDETTESLTIEATSTLNTTKSGTATARPTNPPPVVTGVTVSPNNIHIQRGTMQLFTAAVTGLYNPSQTVTWNVSGNSSTGTVITSGLLFIAADETATTLTVTATPTADYTKFGTATVTVTITPVVNATIPRITTQPTNTTTVNVGGTANLSITAAKSDTGTLSYQWYSNTKNSNSGGTLISGATGTSCSVPTTTAGTRYYYCIITNTNNSVNGTKTVTVTSNVATVTVNPSEMPTFYQSFENDEVRIWADTGVIPVGAEFEVIAILQPPFPDRIVNKVNEQTIVAYYEIRLFDKNGDLILDFGNKEITIALKLAPGYESSKGISIYMEDPTQDGKLVKMESRVEDGYIIFKTSWLETYD